MEISKRIAIAEMVAVIGLGLCPASKAQVSCSPTVPVRTCKEVARVLDVPLELDARASHQGVQLELVSPAEYKARANQITKGLKLGRLETAGCAPGSEKLLFLNCEPIDVLFLRGSSSDLFPTHILVSSDEAGDALALMYFVQGYYAGLTAGMAESQNKK